MTEESSGQLSWKIPWKDVISSAVPLLSILGLALYALSSYAYGHFYSSLGTTPADVGLTYVGMLVASTGWAIALALGLAFVVLVITIWYPAIRLGDMVGEHLRMSELLLAPYRRGWSMFRSFLRDREWRLPRRSRGEVRRSESAVGSRPCAPDCPLMLVRSHEPVGLIGVSAEPSISARTRCVARGRVVVRRRTSGCPGGVGSRPGCRVRPASGRYAGGRTPTDHPRSRAARRARSVAPVGGWWDAGCSRQRPCSRTPGRSNGSA